jgi:hypothetical protein
MLCGHEILQRACGRPSINLSEWRIIMSNKTWIPAWVAGCLLLALGSPVLAANIDTSTAIGINPNPVIEGNPAAITGTLTYSGGAIDGGDMNILKATNKNVAPVSPGDPAIGDPVPCGFRGALGHTEWVQIASGTTNGSGQFSTDFNTSVGMGGKNIGFMAAHPDQFIGSSSDKDKLQKSESACMDLVINPTPPGPGSCTPGATIAATLASGDGTPPPGDSGPWSFRITVTACGPLTGVTAQGGANGWAGVTDYTTATGSAAVRKATKKNTILLWDIGDMADGQTANLDVTVSGPIPNTAPDCELRYLSGAWSASYTLPSATTRTKSEYSGRVAITVDTNDDGNPSCP